MIQKYGFIITLLSFGLCGVFGASFLFVIWTWLLQPRLFNDGQYVMVFFVTCPLGWLAGSILGLVRGLVSASIVKPQHPYLLGIAAVVGGFLIVPVPGMMFMANFFARIWNLTSSFRR